MRVQDCIKSGRMDEDEKEAIHSVRQQEGILNPVQLAAVMYVQKEARKLHELKRSELLTRFKSLGQLPLTVRLWPRY